MLTENNNQVYVHVKLVSMMMVLKSVKLVTILVSLVLITKNVMLHVLKTELMPHIVIAHQKLMIMVKLIVQIVVLNVKPVLKMLVTVPNVKMIEYQELNQNVHVSLVLSQIQNVNLVLTDVLLVLSQLTIVNLVPKTESTFHNVSVHQVIMTMVFMLSVHLVLLNVMNVPLKVVNLVLKTENILQYVIVHMDTITWVLLNVSLVTGDVKIVKI
jgi:hypothetical protein